MGEHTDESTEESTHMREQRRKTDPKPGSTLCASVRGGNADGHVTRAIFCGNLQDKCRTPSPQEAVCVEIYRKNAGPRSRGARFVRACAIETHMDIS